MHLSSESYLHLPLNNFESHLDVLNKFRIEERESSELILVQVHHEQLVRGSDAGVLLREALVEVGHVSGVFLKHVCVYSVIE